MAERSATTGDLDRARTLLDQATVAADASNARGIRRWIDAAGTELTP